MKFNLITPILLAIVLITACKKEPEQPNGPTADTTAPVISVNGGITQFQNLPNTLNGGNWNTPIASAIDNIDGDISSQIVVSGTVNPNFKGVYNISYTVTDAAGNTATTPVDVNIVNSIDSLAGNYLVYDTIPAASFYFQYPQTVTSSNTINGQIHFDRFADYINNTAIYAQISNSVLTLPLQTTGPIGTNNEVHSFIGNGSFLSSGELILNYSDNNQTNSSTANGVMHLIPQ
jgi:Domain of unknown function (DUF5011)